MFRVFLLATCLAATIMAAPASAAETLFKLFGDSTGEFRLPTSPTPDEVNVNFFILEPRPGQLNGITSTFSLYFFVPALGGGFEMFDNVDGDNFVQLTGRTLFTGTTTAPRFVNGTYELVRFGEDVDPGNFTLVISTVPEPASWAMLIAGFGLTGAALRRRGLVAGA